MQNASTLRRGIALGLAALLGCTDDILPPRVNFADAIAMPSCGPADGGAVAIFLTSQPIQSDAPSPPYLRINIWRSLAELNNQTFPLEPSSASAFAAYFAVDATPVNAVGGSAVIFSASPETGITGQINAVIPDHGVINGTFSARWIPTRTTLDLCG
jgi:hypothetical protein